MAKKGNEAKNKGINKSTGIIYTDIRDIYITGNFTLRQLAEQFGIKQNTLEVHSATNEWSKQKREYTERFKKDLQKKLKENIIEEEIEINKKHYKIWNKIYDIIDEVLDNKDVELKFDNGNYRIGQVETITNIMIQTQGGQRLAGGLIEASKLREIQLNEKRLVVEQDRDKGPVVVPQDRTFITALENKTENLWGDGEMDKPETETYSNENDTTNEATETDAQILDDMMKSGDSK